MADINCPAVKQAVVNALLAWLPTPDVYPLRPALEPCPTCGVLVCVRLWHFSRPGVPGRWEELAVPQAPVLGEAHVCS
jgi:hypothetical protein